MHVPPLGLTSEKLSREQHHVYLPDLVKFVILTLKAWEQLERDHLKQATTIPHWSHPHPSLISNRYGLAIRLA